MFSLRTFHLLFILVAVIAADMFGAWGVWMHGQTHDAATLAAGLISFGLGFGLVAYLIWVVHKLDQRKIE